MHRSAALRFAATTLILFLLFVAWDLLGQDLAIERWFGSAQGFPLVDHWLFSKVLHQGARRLAWTLQLLLLLSVLWPVGVLRRLTRGQRLGMFFAAMVSLVVVNIFKNASLTSCPWDLREFGGKADYVSHWMLGVADGGIGRCFPAGHASAAFCFLSGYFWLREKAPRAARIWLVTTLLAGLAIGLAQQVRGAHYMSHTLWTAWVCWLSVGLVQLVLDRRWWHGPGAVTPAPAMVPADAAD